MLDSLLKFPGLPWVSDVLATTIVIAFETTFFVLFMAVVRFYVKGVTRISRITGRLIGILAGFFFAGGYTRTFTHYFPLNAAMTSLVLGVFILANVAITSAVYASQRSGGANGAGGQNP